MAGRTKALSTTTSVSASFSYTKLDKKTRTILQGYSNEIKSLAQQALQSIVKAGLLLSEAKALIPYGDFQRWCDHEFGGGNYHHDTITNWINLAKLYQSREEEREALERMPLSALYKIARPSVDKEVQTTAVELAKIGQPLSVKETDIVIDSYRKLRLADSGIDREAQSILENNAFAENIKELSGLAKLSRPKQIAVANLIVEGAATNRREALKYIQQQKEKDSELKEEEKIESATEVVTVPTTAYNHIKGDYLIAINNLKPESLDCVIVEAPLRFSFVEEELATLATALYKACSPGAFVLMTVGHKAIFWVGDKIAPFSAAHCLVMRRQPGHSRSIVGLNITSASVLLAFLYKSPYASPDKMIVDLQTISEELEDDSIEKVDLEEVSTGLENCFTKFLTPLIVRNTRVAHIIVGDHFGIRDHLFKLSSHLQAESFTTIGGAPSLHKI